MFVCRECNKNHVTIEAGANISRWRLSEVSKQVGISVRGQHMNKKLS